MSLERDLARKRRSVVPLAVAGVVAVALAWFFLGRRDGVTVVAVVRGTAIDAAYASAVVEAQERAVVKAKLSGTVADLAVHEGDPVKKDQILARIDAPSLRADLS